MCKLGLATIVSEFFFYFSSVTHTCANCAYCRSKPDAFSVSHVIYIDQASGNTEKTVTKLKSMGDKNLVSATLINFI